MKFYTLSIDPFKSLIFPRPIGWISSIDKKGTVNLEQNYILTDSEIDEGLIITCQAYPTSEEIYLDADDI